MYRKFAIAAAFVLATSVPALAGECGGAPIPPDLSGLNGATATKQQLVDAIKDFKSFQGATDQYQACLVADVNAKKEAAANAKDPKPVDPAIIAGMNSKLTASQTAKAQVGSQLNAQIIAYKKAHS
jgi:non-homologous end joining protein Ku